MSYDDDGSYSGPPLGSIQIITDPIKARNDCLLLAAIELTRTPASTFTKGELLSVSLEYAGGDVDITMTHVDEFVRTSHVVMVDDQRYRLS